MTDETITLVSGLPRSGTSLMMRMLHVGGLPVLSDGEREADEDNLGGYFELEAVKITEADASWVGEARGKVVKVIHHFLEFLPPDRRYRVLFMRRRLEEIIASQRQMLIRRGSGEGGPSDREMTVILRQELLRVMHWLKDRPNFAVLYVDYNELMSDPTATIASLQGFLGPGLDYARMAEVVDPTHYRQRGGTTSPFRKRP
ncbi:MAG: sulfotransferase family protein [Planctomycetes bacterium]|nr:sulfotransferase family protein [Planctomycetota bacterium]